jgi:dihydroorotate dehydrogenase electron transfer subunit
MGLSIQISPQQLVAPVIDSRQVMPGVFYLKLKAPPVASLARPGQFAMLGCGPDVLLRRPLSFHNANSDTGEVAFLYGVVGRGTRWLSQLKPGDTVDILGPLGNGFTIKPDLKNILIIAGGMGVAPLCFLARQAQDGGRSVTLLLGAASAANLCPAELLPAAATCQTATEDGSAGVKGLITDCLPQYIDKADQVFACGPLPMYRTLAKELSLQGKPVQVSLEVRMACGLGVCYGCSIKTRGGMKKVCRDGPVFSMQEVAWEELAGL